MPGRYKRDGYRTRILTGYETALLLEYTRIPNPENLRVQRSCPTVACCTHHHYEILPCMRGNRGTTRASRLEMARTPEQLFPPRLFAPLSPRGHARTGGRNPNNHITPEQAAEVLRLRYCAAHTYSFIAQTMGLKLRAVCSVCNGNTHRGVAQSIMDELIAGARAGGILPPSSSAAEVEEVLCASTP